MYSVKTDACGTSNESVAHYLKNCFPRPNRLPVDKRNMVLSATTDWL